MQRQKVAVGTLFLAILFMSLYQTTSSQSGTPPTSATDVTKAEIEAVRSRLTLLTQALNLSGLSTADSLETDPKR